MGSTSKDQIKNNPSEEQNRLLQRENKRLNRIVKSQEDRLELVDKMARASEKVNINLYNELEHELKVAQALLREAKERVEGPLLGESPAVRGLREAITRYAETDGPLLVAGPRGVGH